jgi:3-methyladenine DNA glycosylase AlkD
MNVEEVLEKLRAMRNEKGIEVAKRFGIVTKYEVLGISRVELRKMAREIGKNTLLALELWKTNVLEAKILATLLANPKEFKKEHAYEWVKDIDNWDLCDQFVLNLLCKTDYAVEIAKEFCRSEEEFVKRTGLVLIAKLAMGNRKIPEELLRCVEEGLKDKRKYVRKAALWARREIERKTI